MCNKERRVACVCGWRNLFGLRTLLSRCSHSNTRICGICGDAHYQISFNPGEKKQQQQQPNKIKQAHCVTIQEMVFSAMEHNMYSEATRGRAEKNGGIQWKWGWGGQQNGVHASQTPNCAWRLPTHHFPPGAQREHWGVAGRRLIVFLLLCTLSTQLQRRLDFDLCRVFTQCPYCAAATLYWDDGSWILVFTNQCRGADLDNSSRAVIINRD